MKKVILVVLVMVFMLALATSVFAGPETGATCDINHNTGPSDSTTITVNLHATWGHLVHGDEFLCAIGGG